MLNSSQFCHLNQLWFDVFGDLSLQTCYSSVVYLKWFNPFTTGAAKSCQEGPTGNVTLFLERPKAAKQTETIFETLCSLGQAIFAYLLFLLFKVSVDQ